MAAADDLDPVQSQRRANDELRAAMLQLDEHIQALTAPTMELALIQKKRAAGLGLEERAPSDLLQKFVSQAGPGAKIGAAAPGQLGPDASEPWAPSTRDVRETMGQPGVPREQAGKVGYGQPIGPAEAKEFGVDQEPIPWEGRFQLDAILKMARAHYSRKASEEYESGELQPGETSANASMAGTLNWASSLAPKVVAAKQVMGRYVGGPLRDALDWGVGAANFGTALGYSPQAGTGINASHIAGIINPIAMFTSPAARQGLGTVVNAAEEAIGGTGIGIGEANQLRQTLAQQGWSNQRSGGLLGATVGGQQENIAQALAPLVKMGFNSPTSIEQLGSWTNTLRLGQTNPEELKKTLEQLPEAAKILHKTLEEATQGMEDFAAKAVEGGATMIHGGRAYSEIAKITGMNPDLIQQMNESQFGQAQAIRKHIMPWEISSLTGGQQAMNAHETLKTLEGMVPARDRQAKMTTNALGEKVEMTAEEAKYAYIHGVLGGPTAEQAKLLNQTAKRAPYAEAAIQKTGKIGKEIVGWQEYGQEYSHAGQQSARLGIQSAHTSQYIEQLKREVAETPSGGFFGGQKKGELEEKLRQEEEKLSSLEGSRKSAVAETRGKTGLSAEEQAKVKQALTGPQGVYERALQAEVPTQELERIQKLKLAQQPGELEKAVAKISEVKPEGEEGTPQIGLTKAAEYWFKLEFPKAKSPKEEMGAGGKSGASAAGQAKTPGETAQGEAARKQFEKVHRKELTAAEG